MNLNVPKVYLLGAGNLAREIGHYFHGQFNFVFVSDDPTAGVSIFGIRYPHLAACPSEGNFIVALGSVHGRRALAHKACLNGGFPRITIVHEKAINTSNLKGLGHGGCIFPFAVVQHEVAFGDYVIVQHGATVGHNARLGECVICGPGAFVGRDCVIDAGVTIGAGASIREGIYIAENCTVGMGAVVVKDCLIPNTVLVGVPARARDSRVL